MAEVMIARLEENLKQAMLYGVRNYIQYLQVDPGKLGAEVSEGKTINQRKTLPMECAQGDQPVRCPNRVFCANQPSAIPMVAMCRGDVTCFDVMRLVAG